MKTQILLLLLVAAAVQCHSSHHGRSHGHYHRPYDSHRRHDSREKHRHHNYHDSPDSFEDSSKDLEDYVNPSRTPRSELENFVVDLKPIDNPVKDSTGNKSAMDTEVDKKAYDTDKEYSGIKADDITSDDAGPNNVDGDANATNVNGMSLNSNDMSKSDGTISGNGFSPNEAGNVGNNLESNLGADSGNHKFGRNIGVNLGGNLGLPLVNKPGLRLGGNFGVPFSGNLGVNLRSYPRFPMGIPSNDRFGINLGRNLGFPTFGIKDFRSIPYLHLGGNRGLPSGNYLGFPQSGSPGVNNLGLSLDDNSGLHLGGNLDKPLGRNFNGNIGHNLGADSLSINSQSSLEDLIENNNKHNEKYINNVNNQPEDVDNLEQTSNTIDDIKQTTNDNVGSGGNESIKADGLLLDGDYNNNELKSNNTDVRSLSPEIQGNNTNDWVSKAEGELPTNHEDLNGDNLGSDNYNDTDKEKPVIDTHLSNIDEILISPEHDNIENTRPMSTDDLSEIPSIKTPDKNSNKEDDGVDNQLEMIPVLLPGGGYVLLPSSILSDMPSYIVVMINGQPTLLQNPSYDINDGSLDLSKLILANGLSVSGAVLPSWYNLGALAGDDGVTIGASPDGPRPASPIWVGGSDATISPLNNPYSESIPVIDSIPRPVPTLPISVPGMIDPGFSPSYWNTGFSNNHNLQNPGSYTGWGNQINPDTNVNANIANPTSPPPTYPYPQYPYPYLYPPYFNSNNPTNYPSSNNNNYSGKNGPIDTLHQQENANPNDMSSSNSRKPYPSYSLNPRPDIHQNVSEGKLTKAKYELHPQPQTGPDGKSHLYTHPFYPQDDFHEPNSDVSIEPGHHDDERNELHPDNWDDKSIEQRRLDLWDDLKSESSQEDRDDVKIIDSRPDHQHGKWTKYHPNLQDNNGKENSPDHRDDKWNKLHPNEWHDKSIELHSNDRDDKKIESHLGYKDDKRIEPHSNHWDDKKIESHPQLTDDDRIKFHTDDWDNKWIEPHPNDRNNKRFESRPNHWDDKTIKPHPDDWEDERIEQHPYHWEDNKIEPHPDHRDDKMIDPPPQHHWGDKRTESHHNQWDGKRFESHPDHWDDKSDDSNPEDWDDERIESHADHWDDEKIKSHPDHWDKNEKRTYPHQPESQTDDLTFTHSEKLPNMPFHPEQGHGKPYPDIPGFHFTLPRPTNVDNSEKTSLVNGLIDSLNILLKYPSRDGNESKEVRSLIKLLLAILKPGDRNQMLVPKLNDDVENELDLANVNHLLLHLLSGYYEPNLKLLLDPSLDESTRTNLILLLKLLVNNQDSSPPKGTENPLLYFLGQFPCDLSKKREESEALSSKLLQLLAENSDRGDLHTRLERTVALVSQ